MIIRTLEYILVVNVFISVTILNVFRLGCTTCLHKSILTSVVFSLFVMCLLHKSSMFIKLRFKQRQQVSLEENDVCRLHVVFQVRVGG